MGAHEFDHVHLEVSGDATPGGTLTFDTTGTEALAVLLFVGVAPGEVLIPPYGALFLDLASPWSFFKFRTIPDSRDVVVPNDLPVGTKLVLQELAFDPSTANGNFSNAVSLRVE